MYDALKYRHSSWYLLLLMLVWSSINGCKNKEEVLSNEATTLLYPISETQILDTNNAPIMVFDKKVHNFGELNQGELVQCEFEFSNHGNLPLVIKDVKTTIGSIDLNYPSQHIAKGEKGRIEVMFDTDSHLGIQHRPISVIANSFPIEHKLLLTGEITKQ